MKYRFKDKLRKMYLRFSIKYIFPLKFKYVREQLSNRDFTIISDNCWGARVYQELGLEYRTPFIDLFIYSEDYIKLIYNLDYYVGKKLEFIKKSKYKSKINYPLALLGDIEIHFQHYSSEEEAQIKWNRRVARINWSNLYFKMNDSDGATEELLKQFDRLPYEKKVIFSSKQYSDINSLIWFKEFKGNKSITNGKDLKIYRKYFNVEKWLDS